MKVAIGQEELAVGGGVEMMSRVAMLSDQAARAARLVIDTGLHTKSWTREESEAYMLANTAWAPVDITSEILRYIAMPAQANSYMLGMLEIRRLRDLAETQLRENFSLPEFHDRRAAAFRGRCRSSPNRSRWGRKSGRFSAIRHRTARCPSRLAER